MNAPTRIPPSFADRAHYRIIPWLDGWRIIVTPLNGSPKFYDCATRGEANQVCIALADAGIKMVGMVEGGE